MSAQRNLDLLNATLDTSPLDRWDRFHGALLGWVADVVPEDDWAKGLAYAVRQCVPDEDPAVTVWAEATGGTP